MLNFLLVRICHRAILAVQIRTPAMSFHPTRAKQQDTAEMGAISFRFAAIVALLSLLVIHGARAQPSYNGTDNSEGGYYENDDSDDFYNGTRGRALFSRSWLPARATWYGKPNGAGPDNGGTMRVNPMVLIIVR
jgi:hypothetical protein